MTPTRADIILVFLWLGLVCGALMLTVAVVLFSIVARGVMDAYRRAKLDGREREALEHVEASIGRCVLAVPVLGPWMRRRHAR